MYNGCFPSNDPAIGYQQTFGTVYFGLAGKYLMNNFEFNAALKLSPLVKANDIDQHYARGITFSETSDDSFFSSVSLAAGYYINSYAKIFLEAAYNQFSNGKADTLIENNYTGKSYLLQESAGLSNNNYVLALGLQLMPYA